MRRALASSSSAEVGPMPSPAAVTPRRASACCGARPHRGLYWLCDRRIWFALLFLGAVLGVAAWLSTEQQKLTQLAHRANVQNLADSFALELARQVQVVVSTTLAVGALGASEGEALTAAAFAKIGSSLRGFYVGVAELQFSPYGVIAFVDPSGEGTTIPGLSLFHHSLLRVGARATARAYPDQIASLVGPQPIVGGGLAVIVRHPIFTDFADEYLRLNETYSDPSSQIEYEPLGCATPAARDANCRFPGPVRGTFFYAFATALTRIHDMLAPIGLKRLDGGEILVNGVDKFFWQLRVVSNWHPALNESRGVFAHSPLVLANDTLDEPVTSNVTIESLNVAWALDMAPAVGWRVTSTSFTIQLILVAVFTLLGGTGMALAVIGSVREAYTQRVRSAEQQAATQLEALSNEAAKASRSRLIRTVMHDLRSPLISVDNIARTLSTMAVQGKSARLSTVQHLLHALGSCSTLMQHIVSDMLDFERIEAGRLALLYTAFRPCELSDGALAVFSSIAGAKGVKLHVPPPDGLAGTATILADGKRLQQCVNNALSNAIKFTAAGKSVTLTLALVPHEDREGWALLTVVVRDEGVGVSPDELALLVNGGAFTQVGSGQAQGNGGTGLGLAIMREILRLHNDSTLSLSSEGHGKGMQISMAVNCQLVATDASGQVVGTAATAGADEAGGGKSAHDETAVDVPAASPTTRASASASGGGTPAAERRRAPQAAAAAFPDGYRVLHVDDDAFVRLTLPLQTFTLLGLPFVQAEDGAAALALVRSGERFDCIVLDNQMPGMSGAELARTLRIVGYVGLLLGVTGDPAGCAERAEFETSGVNACVDKDSDGIVSLVAHIRADGARLVAACQARSSQAAHGRAGPSAASEMEASGSLCPSERASFVHGAAWRSSGAGGRNTSRRLNSSGRLSDASHDSSSGTRNGSASTSTPGGRSRWFGSPSLASRLQTSLSPSVNSPTRVRRAVTAGGVSAGGPPDVPPRISERHIERSSAGTGTDSQPAGPPAQSSGEP